MVPTPSQGLSTAVRSQQLLKAQYGTMALGLSGALGQVFIIVTMSKFGALTCSIIGLAYKVTTLVASIYFYGHVLNATQLLGLAVCIGAMRLSFMNKREAKVVMYMDHLHQLLTKDRPRYTMMSSKLIIQMMKKKMMLNKTKKNH